jgi:hypothetical protein
MVSDALEGGASFGEAARSQCAPSRIIQGKIDNCLHLHELQALVNAWNNLHPEDPIPSNSLRNDDEDYLRMALQTRLEPICSNRGESCWLSQKGLVEQLRKIAPQVYDDITTFALKPPGKNGKFDWLSTTDIDRVMNQYAQVFPEFYYIGCFSSDHFDHFDFPMTKLRNSNNAGLVFNLDPGFKSGSHWVALFFSKTSTGLNIEYFDSTGSRPNRYISRFIDSVRQQGDKFIKNSFVHQKKDSECGVYAMFYILNRLMGRTMKDINHRRITDAEMNNFRAVFFRPPNND